MIDIRFSQAWETLHQGAHIGMLEIANARTLEGHGALEEKKRTLENRLRAEYEGKTRKDLMANPIIAAYEKYYKKFEKTYHVQMQLESIALKGKAFPTVSPLVDVNFLAELETLVLTAGHDVDRLQGPLMIDVSSAEDTITQMNGTQRPLRAGDMIMRDNGGVSCSIIYGQDNRSPIGRETSHVLYIAYAPSGVPAQVVAEQLDRIEELLNSLSNEHRVFRSEVKTARDSS